MENNKRILGLDLGANSIGWALIEQDFNNKSGRILGMGSRIIPMSQDILGEFGKGNAVSQTAERTKYRSTRRLRERHLLRRDRLHRVLNVMGFLPEHYANTIDFIQNPGQFKDEKEPKIAYQKNDFIFKSSFFEMLQDFKKHQPNLLINKHGKPALIPQDWTLYYLRKKGLTEKLSKEEMAWVILNFNQKRGYYQLRGEEELETPNKLVEFHSLKVTEVIADQSANNKGETWYSMHLENGWIYRRSSKIGLYDWKDKIKDFIVTTDLNEDGSIKKDKDGYEKRSFRAPSEGDWNLMKKKTEQEIEKSNKTVGEYIYDTLLSHPHQKIKGKLIRTIERKYYKSELETLLKKQVALQPELFTSDTLNDCVRELYKNNAQHQQILSKKDFVHLIVNDIIFYQRPLRSQKSTISNCTFETRTFHVDGVQQTEHIKAISKSNPYYQEFRVWQWLHHLKIYTTSDNQEVTHEFISSVEDMESLFEFLMQQKEVTHKDLFKYFFKNEKGKALQEKISAYRWNYVYDDEKKESKSYPMNETGYEIKKRISNVPGVDITLINDEMIYHLWHMNYSIKDKKEFENALVKFANKHHLNADAFIEQFLKLPPYPSEYGSFSEKAIKKLLPLMRIGKFWNWKDIDDHTKNRIQLILHGEEGEVNHFTREKAEKHTLTKETDFQGLPLWLAQSIVYNSRPTHKWISVKDLEQFLSDFRQHSLRNPIVEQVITETLRVVKDIWQYYGDGTKDFFDEIHVELGREMKHTAAERQNMTRSISENENTNVRIKALLKELKNDPRVVNVRPYSPSQQEILKIYEEGVLNSKIDIEDDIIKISKKSNPTVSELQRYKLWLEQGYQSPYTGEIIPLNKLFTADYEIEHVIPQSRYFDDSMSNKVICESAVNKLKDNQLGLEFIKKHRGEKVSVGFGKEVTIFTEAAYDHFVNQYYAKNRAKKTKLLLEDIPEKMIDRQMNDTRYISKLIGQLLSNIVRSDDEKDEGLNSKNVLPVTGKITSILKQDWGLNDVWNDLILPRFERMNELTQTNDYTIFNEKYQKHLPTIPDEYSKGFQKKRIDHRHHALDALVIACTTRDHINLLNNLSANSDKQRGDLQRKLRNMTEVQYYDNNTGVSITRKIPKQFLKPWNSFTQDTREQLEKTVASFKQNIRIINKALNSYEKYIDKDGKWVKAKVAQEGVNWSIRKSMHKETVSGKVNIQGVKVPNGKVLTATRKSIDTSFNIKTIQTITDTGIQKILSRYLASKGGDPELAFTAEGLEDLNKHIRQYNDGKDHKPIYKARIYEVGNKFQIGTKGNKKDKFVEAAKGTNLFFAVYADTNEKRSYQTIPLNEVIERQKQGLTTAENTNIKGDNLLFILSPNDLVYLPLPGENPYEIDVKHLNKEQLNRIYKVVSFSGNRLSVIPINVAVSIVNKLEFTLANKIELTHEKQHMIKIKNDRLGNVSINY